MFRCVKACSYIGNSVRSLSNHQVRCEAYQEEEAHSAAIRKSIAARNKQKQLQRRSLKKVRFQANYHLLEDLRGTTSLPLQAMQHAIELILPPQPNLLLKILTCSNLPHLLTGKELLISKLHLHLQLLLLYHPFSPLPWWKTVNHPVRLLRWKVVAPEGNTGCLHDTETTYLSRLLLVSHQLTK
jgi:hypothetical protein